MSGIINGIQSIINAITTIVNAIIMGIQYIINMIKSLIDLIRLLTTTVLNASIITGTLPTWLIAFVTASIGIATLYIILGRNAGKSK